MKHADGLSIDGILQEKSCKVARRREWRHLILECAVIALAVYLLFTYVIGVAVVSGDSLEPYLYDDEIVVYYRLESAYREGDLVVLEGGGTDNVKLIAGDEDTDGGIAAEGVITVDEAYSGKTAGRVVLHIGFEGA